MLQMPHSSLGPVLEIQDLQMRYPKSTEWTLNNLNLRLDPGESLALVGSSGCGKSTIAKTIIQLLPSGSICNGKILVQGKDPRQLSKSELRKLRGEKVGLIFQDPMTRLNPLLKIGDHLIDTLKAHKPKTTSSWQKDRAKELLETVGINSNRMNAYPHEFSGGMRQRVAIALAISLNPQLVIADEPTTSLDMAIANQIMGELSKLCQNLGSSLLLISHDLAMAGRWCNQMAIVDQGKIVEEAPSYEVLSHPKSNLGQRLIKAARTYEKFSNTSKANLPLLKIENLRCWHAIGGLPWSPIWLKAVNGINFSVNYGESLGIVGKSGCGKSTLCRALVGLTPIRGGIIKLQGESLFTLKNKSNKKIRKTIQMVFQDPLASLNPKMTIIEIISDALLIHKLANRSQAKEKARKILSKVGLNPVEAYINRFPKELSGGQQQRVAIARALTLNPKVLIFDESISMLDPEIQVEILELLRQLQQTLDLAIILITHELSIATGFCNRLIVLDKGKIVEEGSGQQLLTNPQAGTTKELIEACPTLPSFKIELDTFT